MVGASFKIPFQNGHIYLERADVAAYQMVELPGQTCPVGQEKHALETQSAGIPLQEIGRNEGEAVVEGYHQREEVGLIFGQLPQEDALAYEPVLPLLEFDANADIQVMTLNRDIKPKGKLLILVEPPDAMFFQIGAEVANGGGGFRDYGRAD